MFSIAKDLIAAAFLVLIVGCILSVVTCSYYKGEVKDLENGIAQEAQKNAELREHYTAEAYKTELAWKEKQRLAYENHVKELQKIKAYHSDSLLLVERLRNKTAGTIQHLSFMDPQAYTDYTTARADAVVEGAALLAEADSIAREYDAEIERIIADCSAAVDVIQEKSP